MVGAMEEEESGWGNGSDCWKQKKPFATLASANFSQVGITESEKIG
jgi:hypothetical protein